MTTMTRTTAPVTKKVISQMSNQAQRIINNAEAKKIVKTIIDTEHGVKYDIKVRQPEKLDVKAATKAPDEAAITKAKLLVDQTRAAYDEARKALTLLTGKKPSESKGPGIIVTILDLIQKSGAKGITKQQIHDQLVKMFPDHEPIGLGKTIAVQLPGRMARERGVNIIVTDGHYSIK